MNENEIVNGNDRVKMRDIICTFGATAAAVAFATAHVAFAAAQCVQCVLLLLIIDMTRFFIFFFLSFYFLEMYTLATSSSSFSICCQQIHIWHVKCLHHQVNVVVVITINIIMYTWNVSLSVVSTPDILQFWWVTRTKGKDSNKKNIFGNIVWINTAGHLIIYNHAY